jgi:glycerol 2-dehydrogenase (NADP+)
MPILPLSFHCILLLVSVSSLSWNTYHDRVAECLDETLKSLGTDYLDLYLVHWPVRLVANETSPLFPLNPDGSRATDRSWNQQETWRQMEALLETGALPVFA